MSRASPPPVAVLNVGRTSLAIVVVVLVLSWAGIAFFATRQTPREANAPTVVSTVPASDVPPAIAAAPEYVSEGPWGRVEANRLVIQPPVELISVVPHNITRMLWSFRDTTPEQIDALFRRADVAPDILAVLTDRGNWSRDGERLIVAVPKAIVLRFTPESRRIIYGALANFEENTSQWAPASFRGKNADDWLGHNGLTERTLDLVRPLIYQRNGCLLFSDYELVLADIESDQQRVLLTQALMRSTVQLVKLRITPETNLDAVIDYWSVGQRRRDIDTLVRSLPRPPEGFGLDIIHLLPPAARRLLYTYPDQPKPGQTAFRDCHWTSINFFRPEFDDRYTDLAVVMQTLQTDYEQVTDPPRLGDIYVFSNQREVVLHSCVYVAGDIVFTKNGAWEAAPWTLMLLPDVVALYQNEDPVIVRRLRAKK